MNAVPVDYDKASLTAGAPEPLGATWTGEGINFAVYSSAATKVEVCLFDASGEHELARLPLADRTENVWHGFLPAPHGVPGTVYGLRVHGPYDPTRGLRYNANKLLLDPYARMLAGKYQWNAALLGDASDTDEE